MSIGLLYKRNHDAAREVARRVLATARRRGLKVWVSAEQVEHLGGGDSVADRELPRVSEILVVIGGDGTLLYAASLIQSPDPVPVLGINMGRLGFLTPFGAEELESALEAALDGALHTQDRMRLQVELRRDGADEVAGLATNDAVISQGALARLIELEARASGELITTYRADGLIVSTPTGSTAYNLAAGGPLLTPGLAALCLTPICPHTLTNRSLVLPADNLIEVEVEDSNANPNLTIDGQVGFILQAKDVVRIARSEQPLRLFQAPGKDIFELMRTKLLWSGSAA